MDAMPSMVAELAAGGRGGGACFRRTLVEVLATRGCGWRKKVFLFLFINNRNVFMVFYL
jgi:hypothetical protein